MKFIYNDGGRQSAGYKGQTSDCVTRAIAIVTDKPYQEVYDTLNSLIKTKSKGYKLIKTAYGNQYVRSYGSARTGINKKVYHNYLLSLSYKWIPTMFIGKGCKVHLKESELPKGRLVVRLSKHLTSVIDGVINIIVTFLKQVTYNNEQTFKLDTIDIEYKLK